MEAVPEAGSIRNLTKKNISFGAIPRKILEPGEVYIVGRVWNKHLQNVGRVSKLK